MSRTRLVGFRIPSDLHAKATYRAHRLNRSLGNWLVALIEGDTWGWDLLLPLQEKWVLYRMHIDENLLEKAKYKASREHRTLGQWITILIEYDLAVNPVYISV
jgi:hypothetical protein